MRRQSTNLITSYEKYTSTGNHISSNLLEDKFLSSIIEQNRYCRLNCKLTFDLKSNKNIFVLFFKKNEFQVTVLNQAEELKAKEDPFKSENLFLNDTFLGDIQLKISKEEKKSRSKFVSKDVGKNKFILKSKNLILFKDRKDVFRYLYIQTKEDLSKIKIFHRNAKNKIGSIEDLEQKLVFLSKDSPKNILNLKINLCSYLSWITDVNLFETFNLKNDIHEITDSRKICELINDTVNNLEIPSKASLIFLFFLVNKLKIKPNSLEKSDYLQTSSGLDAKKIISFFSKLCSNSLHDEFKNDSNFLDIIFDNVKILIQKVELSIVDRIEIANYFLKIDEYKKKNILKHIICFESIFFKRYQTKVLDVNFEMIKICSFILNKISFKDFDKIRVWCLKKNFENEYPITEVDKKICKLLYNVFFKKKLKKKVFKDSILIILKYLKDNTDSKQEKINLLDGVLRCRLPIKRKMLFSISIFSFLQNEKIEYEKNIRMKNENNEFFKEEVEKILVFDTRNEQKKQESNISTKFKDWIFLIDDTNSEEIIFLIEETKVMIEKLIENDLNFDYLLVLEDFLDSSKIQIAMKYIPMILLILKNKIKELADDKGNFWIDFIELWKFTLLQDILVYNPNLMLEFDSILKNKLLENKLQKNKFFLKFFAFLKNHFNFTNFNFFIERLIFYLHKDLTSFEDVECFLFLICEYSNYIEKENLNEKSLKLFDGHNKKYKQNSIDLIKNFLQILQEEKKIKIAVLCVQHIVWNKLFPKYLRDFFRMYQFNNYEIDFDLTDLDIWKDITKFDLSINVCKGFFINSVEKLVLKLKKNVPKDIYNSNNTLELSNVLENIDQSQKILPPEISIQIFDCFRYKSDSSIHKLLSIYKEKFLDFYFEIGEENYEYIDEIEEHGKSECIKILKNLRNTKIEENIYELINLMDNKEYFKALFFILKQKYSEDFFFISNDNTTNFYKKISLFRNLFDLILKGKLNFFQTFFLKKICFEKLKNNPFLFNHQKHEFIFKKLKLSYDQIKRIIRSVNYFDLLIQNKFFNSLYNTKQIKNKRIKIFEDLINSEIFSFKLFDQIPEFILEAGRLSKSSLFFNFTRLYLIIRRFILVDEFKENKSAKQKLLEDITTNLEIKKKKKNLKGKLFIVNYKLNRKNYHFKNCINLEVIAIFALYTLF